MKYKIYRNFLGYFIIIVLLICNNIGAALPQTVNIITKKGIINKVQYNNFDLNVERIEIEGDKSIVYCLEIDKKYPSGQEFSLIDEKPDEIDKFIAAGYPNRTIEELNLDNENDAYFATQIVIWCYIENYDVNKIVGSNPKIIKAIRNIYTDGLNDKYRNQIDSKIYKTTDDSIQEVILAQSNYLMSEEKAESKQLEYAPQEG